jgi:hypothetical protein
MTLDIMSDDPTIDTDDVPGTKAKRLNEAEWTEVVTLYELGKATKQDLADKFGISRQAIGQGIIARGAVYASKSKVVADAVIEAQKGEAAKRIEDIVAFKEKQRKMVEMIQNLTIKSITDKVRTSTPIADAKNDIMVLNKAMATIAAGRDELYELLDLYRDPDGDKETEEFIISEYTTDEIDALNKTRLGISPDEDLDEVARSLDEPLADVLDDLIGGT